jgi:hypothetical protein
MELGIGRPMFTRFASRDFAEMAQMLEQAATVAQDRAARLAGETLQHQPTPAEPLIVLIIDELANLTAYLTDRQLKDRIKAALGIVLSQGRAVGVHVVAAIQDPRKEVLPARGLFPTRIGLRLSEPAEVDMVLGDGMRDRGALCDRIPQTTPGIGYVALEGDLTPMRVRFSYLSYHGLLWLGAGAGLRISEGLGFEDGPRCLDAVNEEIHVVQQLRYAPREYEGGFYLSLPKGGSSGTVDLDPMVAAALRRHVQEYPPVEVEMIDVTSGSPACRRVPLLFTTTHGNPFTDRTWSAEWIKWREKAGWPKEHGGFHALRHFFATTLITNHADPKEVQRALRHSTLQITLETYVHFWPRRERRRGVVGDVLRAASEQRDHR